MSRQYTYQTSLPAQQKPIHSSAHLTSSAFSANANPDEDWTQISDLAERRRIQNRIAQRNYRKKLKKRLEDLERRAGSSSASPPPSYGVLKTSSAKSPPSSQSYTNKSSQQHRKSQSQSQPRTLPHYTPLATPPMDSSDDLFTPFSSCNVSESGRDGSHTPPLFYSPYNAYPTGISEAEAQPYYISPPYASYPQVSAPQYRGEYDYVSSGAGMTLPSMSQFEAMSGGLGMGMKREDDMMAGGANPFSMSYAAMAGLDLQGGYEDPSTPPLCHSYEHSAPASECGGEAMGYGFATPMTMPPSPPFSGY